MNPFKSLHGIGFMLTLVVALFFAYYFVGAQTVGIRQTDARFFGETNFYYWFAKWAPLYLTVGAAIQAIGLSANSGGTSGRLMALANSYSSLGLLIFVIVIMAMHGGTMSAVKSGQLVDVIVLCVCDTFLAFGIPQLVALGMKNVNLQGN